MIPRRARIKGIANIPVRRKPDTNIPTSSENIKSEQVIPEKNEQKSVQSIIENASNLIKENIKLEIVASQINQQTDESTSIESNATHISTNNEKDDLKSNVENTAETKPVLRRWVPKPKPMVSISAGNRRPKPNLITQKEKPEPLPNQNIENVNPTETNHVHIEHSQQSESENVNNTIKEGPDISVPLEASTCNLNNELNESRIRSNSESEKNTTPLSPSKIINRTRIRPTPKLIRRNSVQGSASESEDDTRKTYNRIRNDSVCSSASYTTDNLNISDGNSTNTKQKIISIKVQKLFRRSEQSRKVAEARKEFYTKFGSKIPDRKRLTMMDLIYYNPTTNPMPQMEPSVKILKENLEEPPTELDADEIEEIIDDPNSEDATPDDQIPDDSIKSDEECTPVPQVKVGPNGEIILDEQSLVIEQTGTKKGREQLANSQIVNGDDLNRTYGIYKRPKRAKEWSAMETLRFYRSLNTVGTDFSLMVALFPGRTRRELKVKFKKEEKMNRILIDKALTNPINFDLSDLEKQAKEEEELEAKKKLEYESRKKEKRKSRQNPYIRKIGSTFARTMDEENKKSQTPKLRPERKSKKDPYSILENGLDDIIDSDDSDEEYIPKKIIKTNITQRARRFKNETESDNPKKEKTRRVTFESESENSDHVEIEEKEIENENTVDLGINLTINEETREVNIFDENQYEDTPAEEITNDENGVIEKENSMEIPSDNEDDIPNDLSSFEPGSLMILTADGDDGKPVFKVYMVTPDQTKVEVNLGPDVIRSLTSNLGSDEVITLDLPVISETNKCNDGTCEILT